MKVSELKTEMDGRFTAVDGEFNGLRQAIKAEGDATRRYLGEGLRQLIRADGEATRRHFDVVIERIFGWRDFTLDSVEARDADPKGRADVP